jgi:hypothetical protein
MNSMLFTVLFTVLMAGAIVVMLAILAGLVTDSAGRGARDSRVWLARLQSIGAASKYTELHYTLNVDSKTKALQHLLVQGENVKHVF